MLLGLSTPSGAACLEFSAPLQQGAFLWASVTPGSTVTLDGEALDVMDDGTVFLGFGRDAGASAELVVAGPQECRQTLLLYLRDYKIQRVEGVPAQTVNPPAEQLARIRREGAMVSRARSERLERADLVAAVLAGFVWPVEGPISGVYGSQRYYNGEPRSPHYGVDVA